MEETLKLILEKIDTIDGRLVTLDGRMDTLDTRMDSLDTRMDTLNERLDAHIRSNKHDFKQINKKLDAITLVVAKTMEDVTDIKSKIEIHDNELKVLKGI